MQQTQIVRQIARAIVACIAKGIFTRKIVLSRDAKWLDCERQSAKPNEFQNDCRFFDVEIACVADGITCGSASFTPPLKQSTGAQNPAS